MAHHAGSTASQLRARAHAAQTSYRDFSATRAKKRDLAPPERNFSPFCRGATIYWHRSHAILAASATGNNTPRSNRIKSAISRMFVVFLPSVLDNSAVFHFGSLGDHPCNMFLAAVLHGKNRFRAVWAVTAKTKIKTLFLLLQRNNYFFSARRFARCVCGALPDVRGE